jgi:hypothetical protein
VRSLLIVRIRLHQAGIVHRAAEKDDGVAQRVAVGLVAVDGEALARNKLRDQNKRLQCEPLVVDGVLAASARQ